MTLTKRRGRERGGSGEGKAHGLQEAERLLAQGMRLAGLTAVYKMKADSQPQGSISTKTATSKKSLLHSVFTLTAFIIGSVMLASAPSLSFYLYDYAPRVIARDQGRIFATNVSHGTIVYLTENELKMYKLTTAGWTGVVGIALFFFGIKDLKRNR